MPLALRLGLWPAESSSDVCVPSQVYSAQSQLAGLLLVRYTGRGGGQDVSLAFAGGTRAQWWLLSAAEEHQIYLQAAAVQELCESKEALLS